MKVKKVLSRLFPLWVQHYQLGCVLLCIVYGVVYWGKPTPIHIGWSYALVALMWLNYWLEKRRERSWTAERAALFRSLRRHTQAFHHQDALIRELREALRHTPGVPGE